MKIAIQTVEARLPMAQALASQVGGAVFVDELRRGPLWGMEQIMRAHTESDVLILQDDVIVEDWFLEEVERSRLDVPVMTYFIGMSKFPRKLYDAGWSYVAVPTVWGQANLYKAGVVRSYLQWSSETPTTYLGEKRIPGVRCYWDDGSMSKFLACRKAKAVMTLPHLVQHREEPSTAGNPLRPMGKPRTSDLFGREFLRPWDKTRITAK
jgi:hypothetical protein